MRAKTTRDYLRQIGGKGGRAGTGDAKRRGDAAYYRTLAERSAEARRARRARNLDDDAPGRWNYESDGDTGHRTHYAWRWNPRSPVGVDREDFPTAADARTWIATQNEKEQDQ